MSAYYMPPPDVMPANGASSACSTGEQEPSGGALTSRQFDVVRRFALGQPGYSIARDLRISKNTVWRHRTEAMERYDASSINDLWMKLGWLRVPA